VVVLLALALAYKAVMVALLRLSGDQYQNLQQEEVVVAQK